MESNYNNIQIEETLEDIAKPLLPNDEVTAAPTDMQETRVQSEVPPAEQQVRPRVVFCLPGREYSRDFLLCWTKLLMRLNEIGVDIAVSQHYNSMVHFARSHCLVGDNRKGKNQKPFQGQLPYNFMVWIDSDILFNPEDIIKLLQSPHPVTCGYYRTENINQVMYAAVKTWDEEFFAKNGSFEFISDEMLKDYKETTGQRYMPVDYSGMGFMCFKEGVFEKLEYPWFASPLINLKNSEGEDFIDIVSEDVYLCRKLKDAGVPIMLDTEIRVGHQKPIAL